MSACSYLKALHNFIVCRKKSVPIESNLNVSTNAAYEEVRAKNLERSSGAKEDYENFEVILQSSDHFTEGVNKTRATQCIKPFGTSYSKSEALEYVDC